MLESYLQALLEVILVFGIVIVVFSAGMLIGYIIWGYPRWNKVRRR